MSLLIQSGITSAEAIAAVEAAGLALASGKRIKIISVLTSDHTWSGMTATLTAGENLALGDVGYIKSDGMVWKANAGAASTMPGVVLATGTITAEDEGEFLVLGFMRRDDSWDWTPGGLIYCDTTSGALTQTAPSESGDQVQVVGMAITADIILFSPSYELVEVS